MGTRGRPIQFSTWIARQIVLGARMFVIHAQGGQNEKIGRRVDAFPLEEGTEVNAELMAESISDVIAGDAGERYAEYFVRSCAANDIIATYKFRHQPEEVDGTNSTEYLEEQTPKGLFGQLMRHLENRDRELIRLVNHVVEQSKQSTAQFAAVVDSMSTGWVEGLKAQKEIASGAADRELRTAEIEMELLKVEQKQKVVTKGLQVLGKVVGLPDDILKEPTE